jgi:neutral ceramidase
MITRFSLALLVTLCLVQTSRAAAAEISAGVAMADITPPIGGRTTGYASAQPTDGVHDPLSARVLVLKSSQTTVAIVVWDLCVFNSPWLFERMPELGIDRLLLLNTHTHAGPNLDQADFPSAENPWRRTVEQRVLEAVREAQSHLFPAYFAAGHGRIQLGYNRLVRHPEGYSITHFENPERVPYGPVDPTVSVLRITDDQGKVRAVLVDYACHPVVLGPRNRKLSADYPGVMRKAVEDKNGGALCFFIQGGGADINPLIMARTGDPEKDFPLVETMGKLLATEVLTTLDRMKPVAGKSEQLSSASSVLTFADRFNPEETLRLGTATLLLNSEIGIVTLPGEPFHKFQTDARAKAGLPYVFFFGYCNASPDPWPSYMPDLESAARGGYGASDTTRAEVGAGERLLNQSLAQLYTLQGRLKPKAVRHIRE